MIQGAVRKLCKGFEFRGARRRVPQLWFADDGVFLTDDMATLQLTLDTLWMVTRVEDVLREHGIGELAVLGRQAIGAQVGPRLAAAGWSAARPSAYTSTLMGSSNAPIEKFQTLLRRSSTS